MYEQIPEAHRSKRIFSNTRNPFERFVSAYKFRMWARRHPSEMDRILADYPEVPSLSFEQYVKFANVYESGNRSAGDLPKLDIGVLTYTFIQFFFKDPKSVIANLR